MPTETPTPRDIVILAFYEAIKTLSSEYSPLYARRDEMFNMAKPDADVNTA
jgi:hypothetical protein